MKILLIYMLLLLLPCCVEHNELKNNNAKSKRMNTELGKAYEQAQFVDQLADKHDQEIDRQLGDLP